MSLITNEYRKAIHDVINSVWEDHQPLYDSDDARYPLSLSDLVTDHLIWLAISEVENIAIEHMKRKNIPFHMNMEE